MPLLDNAPAPSSAAAAARKAGQVSEALQDFRLIEELRVSLFAQELKTPFPVSAKRLE